MKTPVSAWSDLRVAAAAFVAVFLVYLSNASLSPVNPDSAPNAYLAASILGDGDLAFSPFEAPGMFLWSMRVGEGRSQVIITDWRQIVAASGKSLAEHYNAGDVRFDGPRYYLVPSVRQREATGEPLFVGVFGPGPGLVALPFAVLAHLAGVRFWEGEAPAWALAKLTAALLSAGSVALLYLTAVAFVTRRRALLVAIAYAVGSGIWAISSQSLWQQTPVIFFLALGVFCLLRCPGAWLRGAAAGLALSAAAACRPTALLVLLVVAAWLLVCDRKAFAALVVGALPVAAALLAYNAYYLGSPLELGQLVRGADLARHKTGSPEVWQTPLWLGALGLLLSPGRGLLVYSPFLAAAFAGAVLAWTDVRYAALRFLTFAVPALWIPAFAWFDWWGGWAYGYRPIIDSLPLLALLCVPAVDWMLERRVWRAAFAIALAWSVLVQALGAFAYSPWGWNAKVIDAQGNTADVDNPAYRGRLWSFRDWQIGYLIANFAQARAERDLPVVY